MDRPIAKGMTLFAAFAGILALLALVVALRRPPPSPPLPAPNGYADFIQASHSLAGDFSSADARNLDLEQLQALIATNAEPLQLAKTGLTRECRVPMATSEAALGDHVKELGGLKKIALALAAEGRLAELQNRPGDAAEAYLNALRLGHEAVRGGLIIDALVGVAIESIGASRLEPLISHLDTNHCRKVTAALEQLEARRTPPETVLAQEQEWTRRCYGLKGQLFRLASYKELRKMEQGCLTRINGQTTRNRRLLAAAAARAYELERGARPTTLADLVPNYLKCIPLDPVTGTNLHYQP